MQDSFFSILSSIILYLNPIQFSGVVLVRSTRCYRTVWQFQQYQMTLCSFYREAKGYMLQYIKAHETLTSPLRTHKIVGFFNHGEIGLREIVHSYSIYSFSNSYGYWKSLSHHSVVFTVLECTVYSLCICIVLFGTYFLLL